MRKPSGCLRRPSLPSNKPWTPCPLQRAPCTITSTAPTTRSWCFADRLNHTRCPTRNPFPWETSTSDAPEGVLLVHGERSGFPVSLFIPTVSLDVISLVVSSCGYYRGQIEEHAAQ